MDSGNISTSPLTASGIAFIGTGVVGIVLVWRLAVIRSSGMASICIAICVAATIAVISLITSYAWNSGFGSTPGASPQGTLIKQSVTGGEKFTLVSITHSDVPWVDINIMLTDGLNFVQWSPNTTNWVHDSGATRYLGSPSMLGGTEVWMNITDLSSNSYFNSDDYLTITTGSPYQWSTANQYTLTILYEPTAEKICDATVQF